MVDLIQSPLLHLVTSQSLLSRLLQSNPPFHSSVSTHSIVNANQKELLKPGRSLKLTDSGNSATSITTELKQSSIDHMHNSRSAKVSGIITSLKGKFHQIMDHVCSPLFSRIEQMSMKKRKLINRVQSLFTPLLLPWNYLSVKDKSLIGASQQC